MRIPASRTRTADRTVCWSFPPLSDFTREKDHDQADIHLITRRHQSARGDRRACARIRFAVAADADLGYLPFQLGSPVGEEAVATTLAQYEPFEAGFPEDGIVLAAGFDFD